MERNITIVRWQTACVAAALLAAVGASLWGQDWPALRGENGTGVIDPHGVLSHSPSIQLKIRWKKKIGSGYSSVVVDRGRLITLYTADADDVIECLDAKDGHSIWRERLDGKFPGENGSFDGPLATPVIHRDRVYGLTPRGKLFCRSLADGREIWSRDLVTEEGAVQPMYGFATSPLIAGGNLVVQVGAKDKSIAAFNLSDGKTLWAMGNDDINSQSPSRIVIDGREIVLAIGGKKLLGIDPVGGKLLFELEHGGGNSFSVIPVPLSGGTLLTLDDNFSKAFAITASEGGLSAVEKWQDRSIKNTYNVPVLVGDAVYAYSTRFLTCVDPATGAAKWKDRNPGDGFLIAVDGKLIITTKTGSLHVAEASPQGYRELAKLSLFDELVWSIPAYADNAIYQRSLGEVACVDIVAGGDHGAGPSIAAMPLGHSFAAFVDQVQSAQDAAAKKELVDKFLDGQKSFPIVEDGIVHFVFRGQASDVAVAGDMFGSRQERTMQQIPETDLFYYAMELPSDQRASYIFLIDYQPQPDPRNERRAVSSLYAGEMEFAVRLMPEKPLEMSWFGMSDWKPPAWTDKLSGAAQPEITSEKLASEILKSELVFDVVTPPGYSQAAPDRKYPVVYVMDGPGAKQFGRLPEIASVVFADRSAPAPILVLVNSMAGGPFGGQPFGDVLVKEIVPYIEGKYATLADRGSRSLWGLGFSCEATVATLTKYPDMFGAAALQSPLVFGPSRTGAGEAMSGAKQPTRIHIEWGRLDMFNPHENWDLRHMSQELFDSFRQGGEQVIVSGGMVNDSTDWSSWQNRFEPILKFLLGG